MKKKKLIGSYTSRTETLIKKKKKDNKIFDIFFDVFYMAMLVFTSTLSAYGTYFLTNNLLATIFTAILSSTFIYATWAMITVFGFGSKVLSELLEGYEIKIIKEEEKPKRRK